MQEIQLKFDAGKGSVSLSRITAVYGDRVGTLPKPTRRGYAFAGWYLSSEGDPTADGAVRVTADTVMDASLFEGDVLPETAMLYARWSREKDNAAKVKKKSSLANQTRAIVILCVVAVVLVAAFAVASVLADIYHYEDTDGTVYTIRKKQGEFGLYLNGTLCDVDKDGYFLTTVGNMLEIDPKTGEYEIYAVVDTFDTEEVGVNRRVLMFKQLTYDESSTNDLSRVINLVSGTMSSSFSLPLITFVWTAILSAYRKVRMPFTLQRRRELLSPCCIRALVLKWRAEKTPCLS